MTNDIQMFTNENFGNVRVIQENGKVLFVGSDVAKALGYSNRADALARHCRCIVKRDIPHPQNNSTTQENGDTVVTTKTLVFQKGVDGIRKVIGKGNI